MKLCNESLLFARVPLGIIYESLINLISLINLNHLWGLETFNDIYSLLYTYDLEERLDFCSN